jgi:hypothetical protein
MYHDPPPTARPFFDGHTSFWMFEPGYRGVVCAPHRGRPKGDAPLQGATGLSGPSEPQHDQANLFLTPFTSSR